VAPDRLRFDFSHPTSLTKQDLQDLEDVVNREIRLNTNAHTQLMPSEQAVKLGAMALFGEKYPEEVRVVRMGSLDNDTHYSFELCGGTHVNQTGDIGLFKIISESGISSGVRRIEALTGKEALEYMNARDALLTAASETLKTTPNGLNDRIIALMQDKKKLESDLAKARMAPSSQSANDVQTIGSLKLVWRNLEDVSPKDLKPLVDQMKQDIGSGIAVATSTIEGNISVVIGVTEDLTPSHNAVDLVRIVSNTLGGAGGGGRPDLAQAGGKDIARMGDAQTALEKHLTR
jgi:alanyl-tRNA synthetase